MERKGFPSLDELIETKEDGYFNDKGEFEDALIKKTEHNDLRRILKALLKELKPREIEILKLRYGLNDGQTRTLEEVGELFSLTCERIRQIEVKGIRRLRNSTQAVKIHDFY